MARSRAYQLIDTAGVVANLSAIVDNQKPQNEAQARELAGLEPEQQREAWQAAVMVSKNSQPTAAQVAAAIARLGTFDREREAATPEPEPVPATPSKLAVHLSSETPERYTPPEIISRAQKLLGRCRIEVKPDYHGRAVVRRDRVSRGSAKADVAALTVAPARTIGIDAKEID